MNTKQKIIFIVLFFIYLYCEVECISERKSKSSISKSRKKNQPINNIGLQGQSFSIFFLGACLFLCGLIVYVLPLLKEKRQKLIKQVTDQFERKNSENFCTLIEDQRIQSISWFMNKKWEVYFKSIDGKNQGGFGFEVKNIIKRTNFVYEVQGIGKQENIGDSQLKGILLFQNNRLSICLDKCYKKVKTTGQIGKNRILVYQGIQQGQIFDGVWYYKDFQNQPLYSGKMKMIHK